MKSMVKKALLRISPARYWNLFARSQNNNEESDYLVALCRSIDANKSFVEFGFGVFELNSVGLIQKGYKGLLLDAGEKNCRLANKIFQKLKLPVIAVQHWIDLCNITPITDFVESLDGDLGVLSVDIDGNDYWILQELMLRMNPEVICVEHNASFGLKSISVPYKPDFDRHKEHQSGWYHGASITALNKLLEVEYSLVNNIAGLNLIFVRNDKLSGNMKTLSVDEAWSEPQLRNMWSGTKAKEQWNTIEHLNFEEIE